MPYMIETWDKPGSQELRAKLRPAHVAYLEANQGLLIACGGKLDDAGAVANGGLYIVDVDSRESAQRFIEGDPFAQGALFERINIQRWRKAFFDGKRVS